MTLDQKIEKLYFSISEVSEITTIEPYTLRYWESEFQDLNPQKNNVGVRRYKKSDIEYILKLKELLHVQKYTIKGAKEVLSKNSDISSNEETMALQKALSESEIKQKSVQKELKGIKTSIKDLMDFLED